MKRRGTSARGVVALAALVTVVAGCDGETDESPSSEEVDCSVCTLEQVCWDAEDYDGEIVGGCMALPDACRDDRSCECINASSENVCKSVGGVTNSDPCRVVEDVPIVECVITLG